MSLVRTSILLAALLPLATVAEAGRPKLKKLDVASLSVQAPDGVCPGQAAQLTGVATLSDGTVLHSRTVDGKKADLKPRDLKLQTDADLDGHDRVFLPNTGRDLVGQTLAVTVEGRGTDHRATAQLPLSFGCQVALDYTAEGQPGDPWVVPAAERNPDAVGLDDVGQFFLPAAMVAQAARDVREARPLLAGAAGASGADGTAGRMGGHGAAGSHGDAGPAGRDLLVELQALDALVLATITDQVDGTTREVVVDPDGGQLHLVTRGGRGGPGGAGGNGGRGSDAAEQGARGGDGGPGGDGGDGGRGGNVTVRYPASQPQWLELVTVDAAGGPGGDGGRGGDGGWGGSGEISGDNGADGHSGHSGQAGPAGQLVPQPM